jgi:hypothetical protein
VQVRYRGGENDRTDAGALVLHFAASARAPIRQLELTGGPDPGLGAELLRGELTLSNELRLFALRPEISAAARSLEVRALEPDGNSRVLLWMLADKADSQAGYLLAEPLVLQAGTRVLLAVHYDAASVGEQARVLLSAY